MCFVVMIRLPSKSTRTNKLFPDTTLFRSKPVIWAEGVAKSFGDLTVIKGLDFRVQRGDRIGIVGANGAGKSTLLKLLTGEIQPDEGKIILAPTLDGIVTIGRAHV